MVEIEKPIKKVVSESKYLHYDEVIEYLREKYYLVIDYEFWHFVSDNFYDSQDIPCVYMFFDPVLYLQGDITIPTKIKEVLDLIEKEFKDEIEDDTLFMWCVD